MPQIYKSKPVNCEFDEEKLLFKPIILSVTGYKIAIETLNEGRIGIGAQMIGIATGALEQARDYTNKFPKIVVENN